MEQMQILTKRPIQKPSRSVITIVITALVVSIMLFHFLIPSTALTYGPVVPLPPPISILVFLSGTNVFVVALAMGSIPT